MLKGLLGQLENSSVIELELDIEIELELYS